jgi:hypothetical protein
MLTQTPTRTTQPPRITAEAEWAQLKATAPEVYAHAIYLRDTCHIDAGRALRAAQLVTAQAVTLTPESAREWTARGSVGQLATVKSLRTGEAYHVHRRYTGDIVITCTCQDANLGNPRHAPPAGRAPAMCKHILGAWIRTQLEEAA